MKKGLVLFLLICGFDSAHATLSDSQITGVVRAINESEVEAGRHGLKKAKRPEVKDFAEQMVQHHGQANKEEKELASKLKLNPQRSGLSDGLERTTKSEIRKWKSVKKGDPFDKTYIQSQIKLHESVLTSIDQNLLPDVKNRELKQLVEKTREVVSQHLNDAKVIQASF